MRCDTQNNKIIPYLTDDRYRFLRHACFLIGFLVLFYSSNFTHEFSGVYKLYFLFSTWSVFMVMFYINMYFLVPVFFFRSQYFMYILLLVLLVVISLSFVSNLMGNYFAPYRINKSGLEYRKVRGLLDGIIIVVPIISTTTTIKLFQRWIKDNERISDLKNLTLMMELNELKNQINPHFLFNMLNNVKALIRKDPEKATDVILKLSNFLRYQLYENNEEKTSLVSEVNFISNFLNLEQIRRDNFSINLSFQPDLQLYNSIFLPPNLFTTFVENAVKHSVDLMNKETYIDILIVVKDTQLHFTCINSKSPESAVNNEKYSGLGLNNIKRRLNLLYGTKSSLHIKSEENNYTVNLIIPIS